MNAVSDVALYQRPSIWASISKPTTMPAAAATCRVVPVPQAWVHRFQAAETSHTAAQIEGGRGGEGHSPGVSFKSRTSGHRRLI